VPGADFRLVRSREDRADVVAEDEHGMGQGARRNGSDIESGAPFAEGADVLRERFFQIMLRKNLVEFPATRVPIDAVAEAILAALAGREFPLV
jgi:hypothetical protein